MGRNKGDVEVAAVASCLAFVVLFFYLLHLLSLKGCRLVPSFSDRLQIVVDFDETGMNFARLLIFIPEVSLGDNML